MNTSEQMKAGVSVAEMARLLGLSRSRFYQLQGSTFPVPVYAIASRRPFFTEAQQQVCLEVRRRNCGIDGKPVLFYARRQHSVPIRTPYRSANNGPRKNPDIAGLLDGLNALGLTTATAARVQEVTTQLFPNGTGDIEQREVLRAVFLYLKRQTSS
jgi:hypothetical protein